MATPKITLDEVRHVAGLARLGLSEVELAEATAKLEAILGYAAKIAELSLDGVPPTSHPLEMETSGASDLPGATLERSEVLSTAPDHDEEFILTPPA